MASNDAVSPTKKPQPIPWTHQETVNLIRAYQEKWYSLKRGPLRANQWEEVAVVVAARCGYDFNHPSKSAIQCRHKMEKLRQRHRAEKHRLSSSAATTSVTPRAWQYLVLMNDLERGPLPISAQPLASLAPFDNDDEDDDNNGDDDEDERENYIKSRSINYILSQSQRHTKTKYEGFSRQRVWDDDNDDDEEEEQVEEQEEEQEEEVVVSERGLVSGLTEEIKSFAERIIGMENLKMEMMKETERFRLEMEKKRIQMIIESQRRVVDSIARAFGSSKRMKIGHPI